MTRTRRIPFATPLVTLHEVAPDTAANLAVGGTGGFDWFDGGPEDGTRVGAGLIAKADGEGTYVPGWGIYVIARATDGVAVGAMGFHTAPLAGRVEIGYDVVTGARGNGYATEALRALTSWALGEPEVSTVCARTAPENTASQRVLERAGFDLTARGAEEFTYELCRRAQER